MPDRRRPLDWEIAEEMARRELERERQERERQERERQERERRHEHGDEPQDEPEKRAKAAILVRRGEPARRSARSLVAALLHAVVRSADRPRPVSATAGPPQRPGKERGCLTARSSAAARDEKNPASGWGTMKKTQPQAGGHRSGR
jgi:hypothetical protein